MIIRPAQPAERAQLEALQRRASLVGEEYRAALLANPDAIALPIDHITGGGAQVAERQGEIVGFSVVLPRSDGDVELDGLFVEPAAWGSAIGSQLVRNAAREAARGGAAFLWVIASPRTEGFYAKCGFERVGDAQTRFGAAVRMRKSVTPP